LGKASEFMFILNKKKPFIPFPVLVFWLSL